MEVTVMAISTVNKLNTTDEGFSENICCPVCEKNVSLRLFSTEDTTIFAKIAKDDKDLAIAVCPNCSTVFSVNKNYMNEKRNGTFVTITKEDLKIIVKAK